VPPVVLAVRTAICSGAGQGRRTVICSPCGAGCEDGGLFPLRCWPWGRRFVPPVGLAVRTAICSSCGAGRENGDLFPLWGWP
ncbi:hypothetical protein, partial [Escherichia coli]|uniref:hypothetical protein n=1 Tax=Escherichia coli TaxID=562 RepID=UPI00194DF7B4